MRKVYFCLLLIFNNPSHSVANCFESLIQGYLKKSASFEDVSPFGHFSVPFKVNPFLDTKDNQFQQRLSLQFDDLIQARPFDDLNYFYKKVYTDRKGKILSIADIKTKERYFLSAYHKYFSEGLEFGDKKQLTELGFLSEGIKIDLSSKLMIVYKNRYKGFGEVEPVNHPIFSKENYKQLLAKKNFHLLSREELFDPDIDFTKHFENLKERQGFPTPHEIQEDIFKGSYYLLQGESHALAFAKSNALKKLRKDYVSRLGGWMHLKENERNFKALQNFYRQVYHDENLRLPEGADENFLVPSFREFLQFAYQAKLVKNPVYIASSLANPGKSFDIVSRMEGSNKVRLLMVFKPLLDSPIKQAEIHLKGPKIYRQKTFTRISEIKEIEIPNNTKLKAIELTAHFY